MFTGLRGKMGEAGQALVELAVFGAFFLLIMSALISYGLRYDFQQRGQMVAFRRALAIASGLDSGGTIRGSGGYSLAEDKYVPDASEQFGVGGVTAVAAGASVTRDYMMHAQAADVESLSATVTDIQRVDDHNNPTLYMRRNFKTAAFRWERGISHDNKKKYSVVYGSGVVDTNQEGDGDLKIIDPCSGEIPDYDSCYQQARMLVDVSYCTDRCNLNKVPGSDQDCSSDCAKVTNPPNQNSKGYTPDNGSAGTGGAWYAANWSTPGCSGSYICGYDPYGNPIWCGGSGGGNCYYFPYLAQLFDFASPAGSKKFGVQSDMTTNNIRNESLNKMETSAATTTQESASWTDILNRQVIRNTNINQGTGSETPQPTPGQFINRTTDAIPSVNSGSTDQTWDTSK